MGEAEAAILNHLSISVLFNFSLDKFFDGFFSLYLFLIICHPSQRRRKEDGSGVELPWIPSQMNGYDGKAQFDFRSTCFISRTRSFLIEFYFIFPLIVYLRYLFLRHWKGYHFMAMSKTMSFSSYSYKIEYRWWHWPSLSFYFQKWLYFI